MVSGSLVAPPFLFSSWVVIVAWLLASTDLGLCACLLPVRRTSDFAEGVDHMLLLSEVSTGSSSAPAEAGSPSPASQLLQNLGVLAQSSIAGAVQVSYGPVVLVPATQQAAGDAATAEAVSGQQGSPATAPSAGSLRTYMLMSRFPTRGQVNAFKKTPPLQALAQGTPGLPLSLALELQVAVESGPSPQGSQGSS